MKTATATTIPADEAPALKLAEDDAPALIGDATAFEVDQATERDIPTRDISPSPYNPRKHFDPDELVKLGQSLRAHGQMQNLVVRPHPRPRKGSTVGYEIIAGERRWQAATLAKLPTMRCRIVQVDDAQAIELAGMENYSRQQLNAIEEAHWFRAMIDKAGYTQEQLAQRLGITQGQVSNRLRLIELPEAWQQRVISGEMPATWLRELAPWAKRPGVLDHLAKEIADDAPNSLDEFRRQLRSAVEQCSRPLSGWYRYHSPSGYRSGEVAFRATSKQREKLDVIEVDGWRGKEPRAFNVAYWGELQAAGEQRRAARSNGAARPADRAAPTNPAEAKRLAAAKVKKAADQLARRVDAWRVAWLQQRIAERLPTSWSLMSPVDEQRRCAAWRRTPAARSSSAATPAGT
jgi:ParB/RepB/Spo0J family partition protein